MSAHWWANHLPVGDVRRADAAFALQHFQQHRRGARLGVAGGAHGVDIVVSHLDESRGQRFEALASLVAACGRQRGQRAAMPGRIHGDDVGVLVAALVGVVARQLDRGLVGFRAAVVERNFLHAGQGRQAGGKRLLLRHFIDVRRMDDARGLLADGGDEFRVGMAQARHADAC
ncbi:hypothetical protein G6F59_013901 [Rhizopus arrhizus]|nr:hypothetical protein G6F59_013901 [Rhizopus arrhizus]